MTVHGSRFTVPGSCSGFTFAVQGSWFSGSRLRTTDRLGTANSEPGTVNLEPELGTRTRNGEPGTLNGSPWE
jgi:hypothetical protein